MTSVRTRFAPSPTGYMHIGGMRTALFNWLWARHNGGQFILRIDDTDRERNIEEAMEPILEAFRWLGLDWDEGPEIGGPHGPYYQSQRGSFYAEALEKLLASGAAYRDFDTPETIKADREAAEKEKRNYLNIRRSLELSETEVADKLAQSQPFVVRLLVPRDEKLIHEDGVRGTVEWDCGLISDPVLARGDGSPLYNFATVVDDHQLQITHVLRGEEHLTNTAIQKLIYRAFGAEAPAFYHIPFITAPGTSKKLSKRDLKKYRNNQQLKKLFDRADAVFPRIGLGDSDLLNPVMVEYYERIGYLPEAILNALSRLGWSFDDKTEIMSREFVIENFTLDRIIKSPAGLDCDKLASYELHWMTQLSLDEKIDGVIPYLAAAGLISKDSPEQDREFIGRVITAMADRLKIFSDILDVDYFFQSEITIDEKGFKKRVKKGDVPTLLGEFRTRLESLDNWSAETLEECLQSFAAEKEISGGLMIHAMRISTTGQPNGPGVYECIELVGQETSLQRIDAALARATAAE